MSKSKQFLSQNAKDIFFSMSVYELAKSYKIVLNDLSDLELLMKLVGRDLTDGTYVDMSRYYK